MWHYLLFDHKSKCTTHLTNSLGIGLLAKRDVLYDYDCPICGCALNYYAGLSVDAVEFVKITELTTADWGLTPDQATEKIN